MLWTRIHLRLFPFSLLIHATPALPPAHLRAPCSWFPHSATCTGICIFAFLHFAYTSSLFLPIFFQRAGNIVHLYTTPAQFNLSLAPIAAAPVLLPSSRLLCRSETKCTSFGLAFLYKPPRVLQPQHISFFPPFLFAFSLFVCLFERGPVNVDGLAVFLAFFPKPVMEFFITPTRHD